MTACYRMEDWLSQASLLVLQCSRWFGIIFTTFLSPARS